jgi:hypothetical protein
MTPKNEIAPRHAARGGMAGPSTAAGREERMELDELRERADQTAREAAQTLGELAERLTDAGDPRVLARRASANARHALGEASGKLRAELDGVPGRLRAQSPAVRAALTAVPVIALLAVAAVVYRKRSNGARLCRDARGSRVSRDA